MTIMDTPMRGISIKYLTDAATASEKDADKVLELFTPTNDRKAMGDVYTEILGYNPITAFDFEDIQRIVKDVLSEPDTTAVLVTALKASKDKIVARAMEIYEESRDSHIRECIAKAGMEILEPVAANNFSVQLCGYLVGDDDDGDDDSDGLSIEEDDIIDTDVSHILGSVESLVDDDPYDLQQDEDDEG